MTEIRFYHLTQQVTEQALPALLQKVVQDKKRVQFLVETPDRVRYWDEFLWTYTPESFLPHAVAGEDNIDQNPIIILPPLQEGTPLENTGFQMTLVLGIHPLLRNVDGLDLCCYMFEDKDQETRAHNRTLWQEYKNAGFDLTYWQQKPEGGWEKK